jgi:glycosyltransferase involved in cell wall biosynthesis
MHAPADSTGAAVHFVSKDCCPGLTAMAIPHRGGHRLTLRPAALERHLSAADLLVLHEGWVLNNIVAAAAAHRSGVPYMVMPHGVYEPAWTNYLKPPRRLRNELERRVLERAVAVHMFFDSEIVTLRKLAPHANTIVIPTGFDVPAEHWRGGGGYLGWIGRMDPVHKGLDLLIGAIAQLPPADRPQLRIRGYDYKGGVAALHRLIAERNVAAWVRVEGPIAGVGKMGFLRQSDGYVHPSRWECHSIALLENLALGVPCLVSNGIHMAETLRRSRAALLSSPTEPAIASMLPQLARSSRDAAQRGRDLIGGAFNWNLLIPQFRAGLGLLGL